MRRSLRSFAILLVLVLIMPLFGTVTAQSRIVHNVERHNAHTLDTSSTADADGRAVYIVRLNDAPLAAYTGGVAGIPATSPKATGARKLDSDSTASRSYARYLAD